MPDDDGLTAEVLAQNVHTFDQLPDKMQRLWEEEWGESKNELFLVVCTDSGDVFVFGEQGRAFGLQLAVRTVPAAPSPRWFTRVEYEILELPDEEPDENDEVRAQFNLVRNDKIADSEQESWVEDVAQQLSGLADKGPHKEEE
jgi:hypothetical protein